MSICFHERVLILSAKQQIKQQYNHRGKASIGMKQNKKRAVNPQQKIGSQQVTDSDNDILGQIYKQLEELYKMRLVQKLARPIDIRSKESYAQSFDQLLQSTHGKINRFRVNLIEKMAYEESGKQKSMEEEFTNRNSNLKKKIRLIQSKYNEVFLEGSFKHYERIKQTFHLATVIEPISIADWARQCIEKLSGVGGACC